VYVTQVIELSIIMTIKKQPILKAIQRTVLDLQRLKSVVAFPVHRAASAMTGRCVDLAAVIRASAQGPNDRQLGGPEKGHHEPAIHEDTVAGRMKDARAISTGRRQLASR
jgi:hypothetical protein